MKGLEVIGSYLDEWNIVTITVRLILAVVCGGAIGLTEVSSVGERVSRLMLLSALARHWS